MCNIILINILLNLANYIPQRTICFSLSSGVHGIWLGKHNADNPRIRKRQLRSVIDSCMMKAAVYLLYCTSGAGAYPDVRTTRES